MAWIKTSVFTYANSLSTPSHHPCHSPFVDRDHLRSKMGIISGPGSFAVQFADHLRSGIICGPRIICGPVQSPCSGCWPKVMQALWSSALSGNNNYHHALPFCTNRPLGWPHPDRVVPSHLARTRASLSLCVAKAVGLTWLMLPSLFCSPL